MGCITSTTKQTDTFTFHFAGIRKPKSSKTSLNVFDISSIITVKSSLTANDSVFKLKKLIYKTYKIPSKNDILILYSHDIISNDDELTLNDFGITNNSLLLLAITIPSPNIDCILSSKSSLHPIIEQKMEHINDREISLEDTPPFGLFAQYMEHMMEIENIPQFAAIPGDISISPQIHHQREPVLQTQFIPTFINMQISDNDTSDDDTDSDTDSDHDELYQIGIQQQITRHNIHNISIPTTPLPSQINIPLRRRNGSIYNRPPIAQIQVALATDPRTPSPRFITRNNRESLNVSPSQIILPDIQRVERQETDQYEIKVPVVTDDIQRNIHDLSPTVSNTSDTSNDLMVNTEIMEDDEKKTISIEAIKGFDIIMQEEDVLVYKMPKCRHLMNKESLYQYALNVFSEHNNIYLKCPHSVDEEERKYNHWDCNQCTFKNNADKINCAMCTASKPEKKPFCDTKWEYSSIKHILTSNDHKMDVNIDKMAKLELLSARNKMENDCNIQKCPKCETLYFREKDDLKCLQRVKNGDDLESIFKAQCVLCNDTSFCWGCGIKWDIGHICDSSFKSELIDILKTAEHKKIGDVDDVPSIRCCPNCCQLINHISACKHIQCKGCKTDFCFICMKTKKNGNWQCGNHSDKCPVADTQNIQTLPDTIVINKKSFKLF